MFGSARRGHSEGTIGAHIAELHGNLQIVKSLVDLTSHPMSKAEESNLQILIEVHDLFKKDALKGASIFHPQSHASLAATFLRRQGIDDSLVSIVQRHDKPYSLFRRRDILGAKLAEEFLRLKSEIEDHDLFLTFQIIDNCTQGKLSPGGENSVDWTIHQWGSNGLRREYRALHSQVVEAVVSRKKRHGA